MTTTPLAEHIDTPEHHHRLTLLDERRLKCWDCTKTILLPQPGQPTSPTSTTRSPDPKPHEQCPRHIGEWAHTCRCCRAETLEQQRTSRVGTGQPPTPEFLAARAQLAHPTGGSA